MEEPALLEALLELASETGLRVRRVGRQPLSPELAPSASGSCRLRGEVLVMLSDSDPLPERVRVLAGALREHRGEALEGRFLAPALRECLERAGEGGPSGT